MNKPSISARDLGIDLVKAAAILGVLLLHTSTDGYTAPIGSFHWTSAIVWGGVVRASVPLFFMCSGALLLPQEKELPLRRLYGKNFLKIVIAMFVWAAFYKVFHLLLDGSFTPAALWQGVKEVIVFHQEFHLYYLHIILLVYAFLPLTRVFVRNADERTVRYALGLWFVLGILYPTLRPYWPFTLLYGIPVQWMMNMTYAAIGYGVLGWYLVRRLPSVRTAALLTLAGLVLVLAPTIAISAKRGALETNFLEGMSVGVCLLAAGLFSLLYRCGQRLSDRGAGKAAVLLSKASFCIFLVHVVWLNVFARLGLTANAFPAVFSIPALAAVNAALSWLCWRLLSKIPFVNRWLV